MNQGKLSILLCMCLTLGSIGTSLGQVPIQNGDALELYAHGMYAPTEMAFDASGNLFIGSGYEPTWPLGGSPTPIFKVLPDGTTLPFSVPLADPDALAVSPDGDVFVGSYGGVITRVDGITEIPSTWLVDPRLRNIDGLRFDPSGDLFAVAIDSAKVHRIDFATRTVEEFADLASLGITGMSGIAFEPGTGRLFVESPLENIIVELGADGTIKNPQVASGFQFLGFIDFDPSGKNDGFLFAPDAATGEVFKVDIETGEKVLLVNQIIPGPVGLVFDPDGVLFFNQNFDQVTDGRVFRLWDMQIEAPDHPALDQTFPMVFKSRFDDFVPFGSFMARGTDGPLLSDGRQFPLSLDTLSLVCQSVLDGAGEWEIQLHVPNKPKLIGKSFYFAFTTYNPDPFLFLSFSKAKKIVVQ